eukprot:TRINITY_DN9399_c0_g1_i1.p1 TRINITY_DN9399_c0_g1~~TRINITY_DN9399_c0_g1_i1.p1  ORF type:complete len:1122 (-),score=367.71 TRINITY_DN9399_c0_g1_i1:46-3411(-)
MSSPLRENKEDLELVHAELHHGNAERTLTFHEAKHLGDELKEELKKKQDEAKLKEIDIDEHYLTLEELNARYGCGLNFDAPWESAGLSNAKAAELLEKNGPNMLTPPKRLHPFIMFLHEFKNPLTSLLLLCGALSLVLWGLDTTQTVNLYLGAVLIVVTFLNAGLEFAQLQKSAAIMDSFKNLVPQSTAVMRESRQQKVPAEELVLGDVVLLKEGDKVPADVRLVYAVNFKVDNSSLTGESDPQARNREPMSGHHRVVEAENLAFGGTIVFSGEGYGVVIRCGDNSVLGQIAGMTAMKKRDSPLTHETERFVKIIAIAAGIMAMVFFAIGMGINPNFSLNFIFLIGIFVANIPQGLPATVTLLLSFAVKRMSEKNVLVKDLQGVDTLGSITMLASDKTGTMTQNKMTVVHTWINGRHHSEIRKPSNNVVDENAFDLTVSGAKALVETCYICSKAKFDASEENMKLPINDRKVFGDATETGLLKFAAEYFEEEVIKGIEHIKVFEVPFNSRNKWALTIVCSNHDNGSLMLYMKGAPERVFARCSSIYENGIVRPLVDGDQGIFEEAYESMASLGQRVLAFAMKPLSAEYNKDSEFSLDPPIFPSEDLVFMGLIGLMDPPKDRVAEAIQACRSAQIQVMMVTGDHPFTAEAIARKVGLITGDTIESAAEKLGKNISEVKYDEYEAVVVHGDKIDSMTNAEWEAVLRKKEVVFARTSPIHKLEIVARCQAMGHIVAVTGDGVNDSPALKKADLGVSMGISGSDISKEVAGMILLDDNFATIVDGIKEGRLIFVNLKKCIRYILTHIAAEIWPFLLYIAGGLPLALNSLQILMIDLGTELPPALAFSWEPAEDDIMTTPPRRQVVAQQGPMVVSAEDAINLGRVPSFIVETLEIPAPEPKKWWQFWKSSDSSTKAPTGERLVDKDLLSWSYLFAGSFESLAGFGGFFWMFYHNGIGFSSLWGLARANSAYGSSNANDATIGGVFYSGSTLDDYLAEAQTSYFASIVIVQFFVLYLCRSQSGFPWGMRMFRNKRAYLSFILSFGFAMFCAYVPFMNTILVTKGPSIQGFIPAVIGGFALIICEFIRRWFVMSGLCGGKKDKEHRVDVGLTRSLSLEKSMKRHPLEG